MALVGIVMGSDSDMPDVYKRQIMMNINMYIG